MAHQVRIMVCWRVVAEPRSPLRREDFPSQQTDQVPITHVHHFFKIIHRQGQTWNITRSHTEKYTRKQAFVKVRS